MMNEKGLKKNLGLKTLTGANLRDFNLVGALLKRAKMNGVDLTDANLIGAQLKGANLKYAKLNGAVFVGADLNGADLNGADLNGTDFKGANLTDTGLSRYDLDSKKARYDDDTVLNGARNKKESMGVKKLSKILTGLEHLAKAQDICVIDIVNGLIGVCFDKDEASQVKAYIEKEYM